MTQGSPSTLKTYDKLNQRCIPHLFNSTGHPAWGDPVNHPWTNGMLLAYNIEALLWGNFIDEHIDEFPDGKVTVAALVMNNDFGKVYDQAFKAYLAPVAEQGPHRVRHRDDRAPGGHGHRPHDHAGRRRTPTCSSAC